MMRFMKENTSFLREIRYSSHFHSTSNCGKREQQKKKGEKSYQTLWTRIAFQLAYNGTYNDQRHTNFAMNISIECCSYIYVWIQRIHWVHTLTVFLFHFRSPHIKIVFFQFLFEKNCPFKFINNFSLSLFLAKKQQQIIMIDFTITKLSTHTYTHTDWLCSDRPYE